MAILIADTFTASNGTAISGRTPDTTVSSRTWSIGQYFSNGAPVGTVDIQNNKASMNNQNDGFAINCGQTDYTVTWYCTLPASGVFRGGCRFRMQYAFPFSGGSGSSENDYYFFTVRFDLGSGNIRLVSVADGTETVIGSDVTMSFSYATTYKMKLVVSGTTYSLYIDDVLKKSETDSTYTGGTWVGFGSGFISGNNFTFDSVEVAENSGTSVPVLYHQLQQQGIS